MDTEVTRANPATGHPGRPLRTSGVGRRCAHPGCATMLSRYNPDPHCNAHGGWSDATVPRPGRKPGSVSARADDA
jgi:hypothetical protein